MTITAQTFWFESQSVGSSISINAPAGVVAGDLQVAVVGSYRNTTGVSAGWTQFVSLGSAGQYLRAAWRIADGTSNDDITYSFLTSGQASGLMCSFRSTVGWDSPIAQSQGNVAGSHSTYSYALSGSLTGVTAGQLTCAMGGQSDTMKRNIAVGMTGTGWGAATGSGVNDYGHGATNTTTATGTISTPSVTFGSSFSSIKYIVGFVLQEAGGGGLGGGGLFWGQ